MKRRLCPGCGRRRFVVPGSTCGKCDQDWPAFSEHPEREDAILYGTREGRSARELAENLGITERSVVRARARLREQGRLGA